jgi:hypothetical protein
VRHPKPIRSHFQRNSHTEKVLNPTTRCKRLTARSESCQRQSLINFNDTIGWLARLLAALRI